MPVISISEKNTVSQDCCAVLLSCRILNWASCHKTCIISLLNQGVPQALQLNALEVFDVVLGWIICLLHFVSLWIASCMQQLASKFHTVGKGLYFILFTRIFAWNWICFLNSCISPATYTVLLEIRLWNIDLQNIIHLFVYNTYMSDR